MTTPLTNVPGSNAGPTAGQPTTSQATTPTALPIGTGLSKSQWEAWFTNGTKQDPKFKASSIYHGTQLQGKTWKQVYDLVYSVDSVAANAGGATDGHTVADIAASQVYVMAIGEGITLAVGDEANQAVKVTQAVGTGIDKAADISPISSLIGFLSALGDVNLWIRVAKVIAGGVILTVGLLKLTGADKAIGGFASKAVKVAPLL